MGYAGNASKNSQNSEKYAILTKHRLYLYKKYDYPATMPDNHVHVNV